MEKQIKNLSYTISEKGEVFSIKSQKYIKKYKKKEGYLQVKLFIALDSAANKRIYEYPYVHRLVAEAFIENPNNLPCINHIDGNKENNEVSNLEWCTYSENMQHAVKTGLCVKPNKITNLENIFNDFISCKYLLSELEEKYQWHSGSRITSIYLKKYAKEIGKEKEYEIARKAQQHLKAIKSGKLCEKAVVQMSLLGEEIMTFKSAIQASRVLHIRQGSISNACAGRTKTAGGFKWKYL